MAGSFAVGLGWRARRVRRRRIRRSGVARRVGRVLLALVVSALVFVALLLIAAETDFGRRAAKSFIEWSGSSTSRGDLRVGRVVALPPGWLVLENYRIIAPNGETVIRSDVIAGRFEWSGLLDGQVRFRPSRFVRTRIRLTPGPGGQVNLVYANEVPEHRFTVPLVFADIELVDNTIFIDLPGKPPLTLRHVYGHTDLHIGHLWRWELRDNHGIIDLPLLDVGFRDMDGRLTSDHVYPLIVGSILDLGVAEPRISMDYFVPAFAGREGQPYFEIDLPAEPPMEELALGSARAP